MGLAEQSAPRSHGDSWDEKATLSDFSIFGKDASTPHLPEPTPGSFLHYSCNLLKTHRGAQLVEGAWLGEGGEGAGWEACCSSEGRRNAELSFHLEVFRPGSLTEDKMTVVTFIAHFLLHARIWAKGWT